MLPRPRPSASTTSDTLFVKATRRVAFTASTDLFNKRLIHMCSWLIRWLDCIYLKKLVWIIIRDLKAHRLKSQTGWRKKSSAPASRLSHLTFYYQRYFQLYKPVSLVFTFILLVLSWCFTFRHYSSTSHHIGWEFNSFSHTPFPCLGVPGGSVVKNPPANVGDPGLIPGSGRSPGEGNGNPLQYSCLENPMDRGAWWAGYSPWGHKRIWHNSLTTQNFPCLTRSTGISG